jgi:arylsulfatase A-like enzyme/Tfp pilus assembly protein PilF
VLTAGLLALSKGWLKPQAPTTPGAYAGYNVLLVTIDTLRADHLPMYGYSKVVTPNLDALAAESLVFNDAISPVPLTLPSHTTMLSGLLPLTHGIPDNGAFLVDPKITTLQVLLKEKGYTTAAFVSSFVLDSRWQLNRGFDTYYDEFILPDLNSANPALLQRPGGDTEAQVERWLDGKRDRPFFLWVHLYDPHQPYAAPEPYRSRYQDSPYDAEIAYTDEIVGRLRSKLSSAGLEDKTVLFLLSDHGESLGDHGETTHGLLTYDSTLHVPFLIRLPKGRGQRVGGVVRHVDLAPTVLDWLGLTVPAAMQGKSLIPLIEGRETEPRLAFSESRLATFHYGWSPLFAVTSHRYELIRAPRPELYDRVADRAETRNIYEASAPVVKDLEAEIDRVLAQAAGKEATRTKVDPDAEESMRALGYLGISFADPSALPDATRRSDPKDKIHLHNKMNEITNAMFAKDSAHARELAESVLAEDPDMVEVRFALGAVCVREHKYDEAVEQFRRVLAAVPDHLKALHNLGSTYQGLGRYKEAEECYVKALAQDKKHLPTLLRLAHLYRIQGQPDKARARFLEAVADYEEQLERSSSDPSRRADLLGRLAEAHFRAGQAVEALKCLRTALELTPNKPTLHYNLGLILEARHDMKGAIEAYAGEVKVYPKNFRALRSMGVLLRDEGRIEEALAAFDKALSVAPDDAETYYSLAETLAIADETLFPARRFAAKALDLAPGFAEARGLLAIIDKRLASVKASR